MVAEQKVAKELEGVQKRALEIAKRPSNASGPCPGKFKLPADAKDTVALVQDEVCGVSNKLGSDNFECELESNRKEGPAVPAVTARDIGDVPKTLQLLRQSRIRCPLQER